LKSSTSFTVTVSAGSTKADVITIVPATITTPPLSQVVKAGTPVELSVQATGATSYAWTHDGHLIAGANGTTLTLGAVQLTDAGGYAVTVKNADTATISATAEVTVVDARTETTRVGPLLALTQTIKVAGAADRLRLSLPLPAQWRYVAGATGGAATAPDAGDTSLLEWTWTKVPAAPVAFTYLLEVPDKAAIPASLEALIEVSSEGTQSKLLFDESPHAR
jgi:hypothetical protein